jgi:hypothetical protein
MTIENNGSLGEALAEQFQGMNVDSPQVMNGELQAPGAPRREGKAQSRIGDQNDRTACKMLFFGGNDANDDNHDNEQNAGLMGAAAYHKN